MAQYSILIIEDSLDARRLLMAYLSTLDYDLKINLVPSAEEAFLIAGQEKIDLLVSDYMLPGMTGADLVRWMRKRFPKVRIIMVTALDRADVAHEVEELQIDSFLKKPLDITVFTNAIEKSLQLAGVRTTGSLGVDPRKQTGSLAIQITNQPSSFQHPSPSPANLQKTSILDPQAHRAPLPVPPPVIYRPHQPSPIPAQPQPQTTIIPQPTPELSPAAASAQLQNFLDQIQRSLPAETVFVLDGTGRIESQSGQIPSGLAFEVWLPVIAKAINENTKLHTLSPGLRESSMLYRAQNYEMIVAILNGHGLSVVIKATQSNSRLWMALSQAMEALSSISLLLGQAAPVQPAQRGAVVSVTKMTDPPPQPRPQPQPQPRQPNRTALLPDISEKDPDFDKLISRAAGALTREQADEYWQERRKTSELPGRQPPAQSPSRPDEDK